MYFWPSRNVACHHPHSVNSSHGLSGSVSVALSLGSDSGSVNLSRWSLRHRFTQRFYRRPTDTVWRNQKTVKSRLVYYGWSCLWLTAGPWRRLEPFMEWVPVRIWSVFRVGMDIFGEKFLGGVDNGAKIPKRLHNTYTCPYSFLAVWINGLFIHRYKITGLTRARVAVSATFAMVGGAKMTPL